MKGGQRGGTVSRGTVLIVERDPFYSSFYRKTLSAEGYRVYLAGGMEEGRRLFGEGPRCQART